MTVLDREQMDIAAATVAVHAYGTAPIIMPCLMSVAATSCGDGSSSRLIDWLIECAHSCVLSLLLASVRQSLPPSPSCCPVDRALPL